MDLATRVNIRRMGLVSGGGKSLIQVDSEDNGKLVCGTCL
jgi:hypothetical protein